MNDRDMMRAQEAERFVRAAAHAMLALLKDMRGEPNIYTPIGAWMEEIENVIDKAEGR